MIPSAFRLPLFYCTAYLYSSVLGLVGLAITASSRVEGVRVLTAMHTWWRHGACAVMFRAAEKHLSASDFNALLGTKLMIAVGGWVMVVQAD